LYDLQSYKNNARMGVLTLKKIGFVLFCAWMVRWYGYNFKRCLEETDFKIILIPDLKNSFLVFLGTKKKQNAIEITNLS